MTSFTLKLGDDFLRIPKLALDGKNWVIYKDRLTLVELNSVLCIVAQNDRMATVDQEFGWLPY